MLSGAIEQAMPGYLILFLVALIFGFLKSPFMKGKIGEGVVNLSNSMMLDKSIYIPIKDVTLKLSDGSTTQIDHILVSIYGIFVIETKNMKGWIFGGEHQREWTQQNFKQKHKFQNPLHQNHRHIKALEEVLELPISKFISVVVFVGECTFKTSMPQNVFRGISYGKYIASFREKLFTQVQVEQIADRLKNNRLAQGFKTDFAHVNNLRRRKESESFNQTLVCSRCGSKMVTRTNRQNGEEFYGCSSYPRCKNIVKK